MMKQPLNALLFVLKIQNGKSMINEVLSIMLETFFLSFIVFFNFFSLNDNILMKHNKPEIHATDPLIMFHANRKKTKRLVSVIHSTY